MRSATDAVTAAFIFLFANWLLTGVDSYLIVLDVRGDHKHSDAGIASSHCGCKTHRGLPQYNLPPPCSLPAWSNDQNQKTIRKIMVATAWLAHVEP